MAMAMATAMEIPETATAIRVTVMATATVMVTETETETETVMATATATVTCVRTASSIPVNSATLVSRPCSATADCTYAMCGDGYHNMLSEQCDDGNAMSNDGCVGACLIAYCGDTFIQEGMEECDDGNMADDDDCTSMCVAAFCGDGIMHSDDEECDDANMSDDDACTAMCTASFCGDGVLWQGMETCDDGNMSDTDMCPTSCQPASCGDGFIQMGVEECDDANMGNGDNCLDSCQDAVCGDGFLKIGVEQCDDGNMVNNDACPNNCGIIEANCQDILTNMNMWGNPASGVDLRSYTNSTLHWIGCPNNGCVNNTFYCNYDGVAHTMQFGTNSQGAMRAVVDPNNAMGDTMPNAGNSCCTANTLQICNAPNSNNNGVNVNMVDALCASLGYANGTIVREVNNNSCPQAHAVAQDGTSWSSDYVNNEGFGAEYRCSQN